MLRANQGAKERQPHEYRGEREESELDDRCRSRGCAGHRGVRARICLRRQQPRRSRQRQPGLRHRRPAGNQSPPPRPQGEEDRDQAGRVAGRRHLPTGRGGQGLPGARGRWLALRPGRGDERQSGAEEPVDLQPDPPRGRLWLHDDPRRDQPLARCPASRPRLGRPLPDAGRVLRLRVREPRRRRERHQPDPQPARLRGGRREHARHRLLRGRLRLLREAPEPRRLRRGGDDRPPALGPPQPGRDGRRLLRRDQPALRRRHQAAAPGRDHPAVGDRQHRHDPLSGRVPQHRFRSAVGPGPGRRLEARVGHRGAGLGLQADPGGRSDLQGQPDAAHGRGRSDQQGPPKPLLPAKGGEPAQPVDLRQQDQRPDLHGMSMGGRADRRALRQSGRSLHGHEAQVVHLRERLPHRLARSRDLQPLVRLPRALRGGARDRSYRRC